MAAISADVTARAAQVTTLVLDVDGVLTDGRIIYDEFGDELKCFDVQDGAALVFWKRSGLKSAIITSRRAKLITRRAKELGVDFLAQKAMKKGEVLELLMKRWRLLPEQVCAMGDDVMELPLLRRAGLAVAVSNAVEEVKAASHYVTQRSGGRGAVREVVDLILKVKGLWPDLLRTYSV